MTLIATVRRYIETSDSDICLDHVNNNQLNVKIMIDLTKGLSLDTGINTPPPREFLFLRSIVYLQGIISPDETEAFNQDSVTQKTPYDLVYSND